MLITGVFILILSYILYTRLEKYEFENRTKGGVVEFESYAKSKWHQFKRLLIWVLAVFGAIIFGLGLFSSSGNSERKSSYTTEDRNKVLEIIKKQNEASSNQKQSSPEEFVKKLELQAKLQLEISKINNKDLISKGYPQESEKFLDICKDKIVKKIYEDASSVKVKNDIYTCIEENL